MTNPSCLELIKKSERALLSAKILLDADDLDGACNRTYYAMFDAAKAILIATVPTMDGAIGKTHRSLITAFSQHMIHTGELPPEYGKAFHRAQNIRHMADYTGAAIDRTDVIELIEYASELIELIKNKVAAKLDTDFSP